MDERTWSEVCSRQRLSNDKSAAVDLTPPSFTHHLSTIPLQPLNTAMSQFIELTGSSHFFSLTNLARNDSLAVLDVARNPPSQLLHGTAIAHPARKAGSINIQPRGLVTGATINGITYHVRITCRKPVPRRTLRAESHHTC